MRARTAALLAATLLVPSLAAVLGAPPAQAAPSRLTGLFSLTPGSCAGGEPTGSFFRMILASGTPSGPFLSNSDSACDDETYTLLSPGTDGGLRLGELQPQPSPAFDGSGNARAARLVKPVRFYGVDFSAATNAIDPQTRTKVTPPQVTVSGTTVNADLRALGVSWNNQQFNQGAPKPDGSTPGNTRLATGRYDSRTGALTLQWTSQIQGGPFNGFTGLWHLTGEVAPATGTTAPSAPPASGGGSGGEAPAPGTTTAPAAVPVPTAVPSAGTTASATPSTAPTAAAPAPSGDVGGEATSAPLDPALTTASGSEDDGGLGLPAVLAVGLVVAVAAGGLVTRQRHRR